MVGPPVLLADGFRSIEVDGRRLAVVGSALDRLRDPLGRAEHLVGAPSSIASGWFVWLATEETLADLEVKLALSGAR